MAQYSYPPLPPIKRLGRTPPFTRIMTLAPGVITDPLHCSVTTINLEDTPPFEALSYVWGERTASSPILCDGRPLSITLNLELALRQLRYPTQPRILWVDAICIDQDNIEERSRQVQYMRLVYKHATRVVVWLGTKTPGIEQAFDTVRRLAEIRSKQTNNKALDTGEAPDAMQFLSQLFDREYFMRTWCIQEVVVSACCIAKCSDLEINFWDLISTIPYVLPYQSQLLPSTTLEFWHKLSHNRKFFGKLSFTNVEGSLGPLVVLLATTLDFKATDPRDKIFALLGISDEGLEPILGYINQSLLKDSNYLRQFRRVGTTIANGINTLAPGIDLFRLPDLKSDYGKDLISVYRDMTRYFIRKNPGVLDVLNYVQHTDDPTESLFPSWVPRWFQPRSAVFLGGTQLFYAGLGGGSYAVVHDNPLQRKPLEPDSLQLDGFKVDVVQKVSKVMTFELLNTILVEVWNEMFDVPLFPRSDRMYFNREPLDVAFCMTLTASPHGMYAITAGEDPLSVPEKDPSEDIWAFFSRSLTEFEGKAKAYIERYLLEISSHSSNANSSQTAPSAVSQPSSPGSDDSWRFIRAAQICSHNRRFYLTKSGYMGIGPMIMRPGDEVCVLFGGRMPFILRPTAQGHHIFIGQTYLYDYEILWGGATAAVKSGNGHSRFAATTFKLR